MTNTIQSGARRCRFGGDRIMIFWGIFGTICLSMVLAMIAEKANRKRLLEGTRRELAAHERRRQQSTLRDYHEPGGWGR